LFKTIFNVIIVDNELWKIPLVLKKDVNGVCLCKTDPQQSNDFLSIGRHETDKEILGRLLCGVYLSNEYAKQKSWKNLQEERT